jgi:N-carbamoyl-L-amino-acid hydrolase
MTAMEQALEAGARRIAADIGLNLDFKRIFHYAPVQFDKGCIETVRKATKECGYDMRDIVSAAGHDACYMARVAPTSMIFVPCIDGISHNEVEDVKPEWITAGGDVLLRAVVSKANEGDPEK